MPKISVVIITFNEERKIDRCINSVRGVADDIVVVDSFSVDNTKQICLENGVRFVENEFRSYIDQKNFAVSLAQYDHILSLDADEFLSEELLKSILEIKDSWNNEAYCMCRLSSFGGKWVRHGVAYPDRQTRLWNRRVGSWGGSNPHERVKLNEGVNLIQLKGDLLHHSYDNSGEALRKIQLYSEIFAKSNLRKRRISMMGIVVHTGYTFFKSYFLKRGFLDGYEGLAVAMAAMNHTFYKYAKLYEMSMAAKRKEVYLKQPVKEKVLELVQ